MDFVPPALGEVGSAMVNFAQLRHAQPALWTTAAHDMRSAASQCERVNQDIHRNGVQPLDEHWPDHVGALAKDALTALAVRAETASILARATVDPLDTLSHAVTIAQNELENGVRMAEGAGFVVNPETGDITAPPSMSEDEFATKTAVLAEAHRLIADAVEAATQADGLCAGALSDVSNDNDPSDVGKAQGIQAGNTLKALEEIRDTLPDGLSPDEVKQWWNQLTPQEQYDLQRACPVELYDLNGIPDDVKKQMDRPDRGYSSVGTVRYAIANYNNADLDSFSDNCTNFVSDSLSYGGGMKQKESWFLPRHFDRDGWSDGTMGHKDILPPGMTHTPTWAAAQNNRDFFLGHGGQVVSPDQARPGDVVYYTMTQDGQGHHAGETHHAAVVTGVLPDGEVLYTQHSDSAKNYPLNGRLPEFEQGYGQQKIEIVQPKRTW
ncbi:amidase domain-containing protein [Mycolicibacterium mucogenicum]|nr:amidase domain-containing protein [Mycolicibacterium mucogenicum]